MAIPNEENSVPRCDVWKSAGIADSRQNPCARQTCNDRVRSCEFNGGLITIFSRERSLQPAPEPVHIHPDLYAGPHTLESQVQVGPSSSAIAKPVRSCNWVHTPVSLQLAGVIDNHEPERIPPWGDWPPDPNPGD